MAWHMRYAQSQTSPCRSMWFPIFHHQFDAQSKAPSDILQLQGQSDHRDQNQWYQESTARLST